MKKIILSMMIAGAIVSCGGKGDKKTGGEINPEGDKKEGVTDNSQNPDYQAGLVLVAKNDCLTCHKIDEMLTGPSYRDIANKYAGTSDTVINYLAGKIISGGNGVWGETVMTPHPGVSKEDAEAMAKYILLLKK